MRNWLLAGLSAAVWAAPVWAQTPNAFITGTPLTAAELNSAFAAVMPLNGGTFTGALGAPQVNLGPIAAPGAPASGGSVYADTSNALHYKTAEFDTVIAGACFLGSCSNPSWWNGEYGFGEIATTSAFAPLRVLKIVEGAGGGGIESGLNVEDQINQTGAVLTIPTQIAAGASSIVTSDSANIIINTPIWGQGIPSGTTVSSVTHNSPVSGEATIGLSAPTSAIIYTTLYGTKNYISVGTSAATESENAVTANCATWQDGAGVTSCVAGFFTADKWSNGGASPYGLNVIAGDHTGLSSAHGSPVIGAAIVGGASGPDNGSYFPSGDATSAIGTRSALQAGGASFGPSADGATTWGDALDVQLPNSAYVNEPLQLLYGARILGIVGWGNIETAYAADGSGSGQTGLNLFPGYVTEPPAATSVSGSSTITLSGPVTVGQFISDSAVCIPPLTRASGVAEGASFTTTTVTLSAATTCAITLADNITRINSFSDGLLFAGSYSDAFANLTNTGAPGVIKFGTTNNTGTVGKLSFMGQDSTGTTVDYGDLTGSVMTNTHGSARGQIDANTEMQITATLPGTTSDQGLNIVTTPIGSGVNGPATAQFGLNITHEKQNWTTTSQVGEIDGANIFVRQGGPGSDAGGFLVNIQGTGQGFIAQDEMVSSIYNTGSSSITQELDTQTGALSQSTGKYYGFVATANIGDLTNGILIQDSGGTTSWDNAFTNVRNGSTNFNVTGAGAVTATTFGLYGGSFSTGGDPTNGAVALGVPGGSGTPYVAMYGNGSTPYDARIINDAANQISLTGAAGTPAVLNMAFGGSITGLTAISSATGTLNFSSLLTATQTAAHPTAAGTTDYATNFNLTDNVNTVASQGVQEGFYVNITTAGSGTITGAGHNVAVQGAVFNGLSSDNLAVGLEGIAANTGGGTLTNVWGTVSKLVDNNGTVSNFIGLTTDINNGGGIVTNLETVQCAPPTTPGTITNRYCIYDGDSLAQNLFLGQTFNSTGQELAPAAASAPYPGRYYWGVNHGAASGTITNLNTDTYWAPFLMPMRQTFSRLGIHVTTASAGATCQIAIYSTYYGEPAGAPVWGPYTISAASTGDVEESVGSPYMSLDAGMWAFGVNCSNNTVAITAYTENAAFEIYAPSTSQGSDTSPITAGTTFGTSPTVTFVAASNSMPQIWARR